MSSHQTAPATPNDPTSTRPAAAPRTRVRKASKANPGGSSNDLRALAVVKIATAHQLWRLLRPHALENKFARAALNDLDKKRIAVKHGTGKDGRDIWA
ncbi:hypothetical protein ACGFX4_38420 [Kitasatospora sp. NPDC048365]|uniref:hypothetical protein n=1 Tax=Kitasatospora sp. NPDC048365 TaxID=3364050 RepID=UPI00371E0D08